MMILALVVVAGFLFWFLATFPVPWAERVARGLFLLAALIWAVGVLGVRTG